MIDTSYQWEYENRWFYFGFNGLLDWVIIVDKGAEINEDDFSD